MTSFRIGFDTPWFLLLLIPAVAVALWPYFRLSKKYRRSRNRVISLALHLLAMVLTLSILSGAMFYFGLPNSNNEILILVDVSSSNKSADQAKKNFVEEVIKSNSEGLFKVGVITFAEEPDYVAELSYNVNDVVDKFQKAPLPTNDSSTNFQRALLFAKDKFDNPKTAKIVLVSDGFETDGKVMDSIAAIVLTGIRIDTVFFGNSYENEAQIVSVKTPSYNVKVGDVFNVDVTVESSFEGSAVLTLFDNDIPGQSVSVDLSVGFNDLTISHTYTKGEMHLLRTQLTCYQGNDTISQNNSYYSYFYLDAFDRILLLYKYETESNALVNLLNNSGYESPVEVRNIDDAPTTLSVLSEYDQIILMNIANGDMPDGFVDLLESYVKVLGGGLLTLGGNKLGLNNVANAYVREDMNPKDDPTAYQNLLPIECVDYYPPLALMLVIDRSGSMKDNDAQLSMSKMAAAKNGAKDAINALSDRDFVGVVSFAHNVSLDLPLTPVPQKSKIDAAIEGMEALGDTQYAIALDAATAALNAATNVKNKHMILITDGEPQDPAEIEAPGRGYNYYVRRCKELGIVLSVISILSDILHEKTGDDIVAISGGYHYPIKTVADLKSTIKGHLGVSEIKEIIPEKFTPTIKDYNIVVKDINKDEIPELGGYYGVKAKEGVQVPLMGEYTPLYAHWILGEGKVGSFMSDLNGGAWSYDFMSSDTGKTLINNMIRVLLPTKSIRISDILPEFTRENFTTKITVNTPTEMGDVVEVKVTDITQAYGPIEPTIVTAIDVAGMPECEIEFTHPGIYELEFTKTSQSGDVTVYKTQMEFSYSDEYIAFLDNEIGKQFLKRVSDSGKGQLREFAYPKEVLGNVKKTIIEDFDPIYLFMGIIIVIFLIDIAVRKFKFKWPWEIARDRKAKKALIHK